MTRPIRQLSARVARRYLVHHHLLAPPRALPAEPASVMRVVDRLGSLQFDPLEVAGRNHDLVLLSRIAGYPEPVRLALQAEVTEAVLEDHVRVIESITALVTSNA